MEKELSFIKAQNSEQILIELLFHFSILMEYQLIDLQSNVRAFVENMSEAIQKMDGLVVEEGRSAHELYESLFNKSESSEASELSDRANDRVDKIFAEANGRIEDNIRKSENIKASSTDALDKIWSEVSKRFESMSRLEERLRPQIYSMIQSLNFEDIQTQRIEHALAAQKKLNEGIIKFIKKGIQNCDLNEVLAFTTNLVKETRASYTMTDERKVFEQVFYEKGRK